MSKNRPISVSANLEGEVEISLSVGWIKNLLHQAEVSDDGRASLYFYPRELKAHLDQAEQTIKENLEDYVSEGASPHAQVAPPWTDPSTSHCSSCGSSAWMERPARNGWYCTHCNHTFEPDSEVQHEKDLLTKAVALVMPDEYPAGMAEVLAEEITQKTKGPNLDEPTLEFHPFSFCKPVTDQEEARRLALGSLDDPQAPEITLLDSLDEVAELGEHRYKFVARKGGGWQLREFRPGSEGHQWYAVATFYP